MQMNRYYTVGIVEDEVIERQALRMIMEEKRPVLQVVFEAEDGNSALKMARQHQPDILIVDIQIPGCTGLELCQELRQEGYSGLIIIVHRIRYFGMRIWQSSSMYWIIC